MKYIESKMNVMRLIMIMLAMVLAGWMGVAQTPDTIYTRSRNYFYNCWYDTCNFYRDTSMTFRTALSWVVTFYPYQYLGNRFTTEYPLSVKGLSCMILMPWQLSIFDEYHLMLSTERLESEYMYLCQLDSATMRMVVLDSVQWDTVDPKIMKLPVHEDLSDGYLYCYAYEVMFSKPVQVSGNFYILGSLRNNVRIPSGRSHAGWFPGLPTIYGLLCAEAEREWSGVDASRVWSNQFDYHLEFRHGLTDPVTPYDSILNRSWGPFHAIIDAWMLDVRTSDTLLGTAGPRGYYADSSYQRIRAYEKRWSRFVGWNDGVTTAERLVHLTSDTVFTAYFEAKRECNVEARSNNGHWGRVTGGGMYYDGDTVTLEAVPERGFAFLMWRDSVRDNPRRVVLSGDTVLEALFILRDTCMVEVRVNNSEWGHVRGGGVHFAGDEVLLTAIAEEGYDFVRWGDGYMSNVRRFVAVGDTMFEAYFGEAAGIEERGGVEFRMRPNPTRGRVEVECGEPGVEIAVRDVSGREVLRRKATGERTELETEGLASGVYFVTVTTERGTGTRKLVIER